MYRYDVRYFDDDAVETHVAWRHLAAFDARLLDSSSSDADSDASSEGASVDDPVAEAVRELAKAVARDPVASVVADLRRQAFVAEPADIAFDAAAGSCLATSTATRRQRADNFRSRLRTPASLV